MAVKLKKFSSLRQIVRASWVSRIGAGPRTEKRWIDDPYAVVLRQKRMLMRNSDLQIVRAFHIGNIGVNPGVGERSILSSSGALQGCAEIIERISAGIVVVLVSPNKADNRQHCRCAEQVRIRWRNVESFNLRALVCRPQSPPVRGLTEKVPAGLQVSPGLNG